MKKVLILAYDFPPYVSVGGLRPHAWYKYLYEFDVYPIVVTRQWKNKFGNKLDYIAPSESEKVIFEENVEKGLIIRTPYSPNYSNRLMLKFGENKYKLIRKFYSGLFEFLQWFFLVGTKSNLYFAANNYLCENKVDVIIATGDPFILFRYASKLSKKYHIPWIADYRDPWTQNKNNSKNRIIKKFNSYFEKKCSKNVSLITTVSYFFQVKISSLIDKPFKIITNGYDPEVIRKTLEIKQNKEILNIAFVGTVYKWHPLKIFIKAFSEFLHKNTNCRISINFYGINVVNELKELIIKYYPSTKEHIKIYPNIPNNELLPELAKNNLMLLFNYYSFIGTKIYDYLAINRNILLCFSNDKDAVELKDKYYNFDEVMSSSSHIQEDLIRETNSGYIVEDSKHLVLLLKQLYNEFLEKGEIPCYTENSEKYSRKFQTKLLADIIKENY